MTSNEKQFRLLHVENSGLGYLQPGQGTVCMGTGFSDDLDSYVESTNRYLKCLETDTVKPPHFLLDKHDILLLMELKKKDVILHDECVKSLETLGTIFNKRIYMRTLPKAFNLLCPLKGQVLRDEIIPVLRILLARQNRLTNENEEFVANATKDFDALVDLAKFEDLMNQLNLDKDQITLIMDLAFENARFNWYEKAEYDDFLFYDSDSTAVMTKSMYILNFFIQFVCAIEWDKDWCEDHYDCADEYKKELAEWIEEYCAMPDNELLEVETHSLSNFEESECAYEHREKNMIHIFDESFLDALSPSSREYCAKIMTEKMVLENYDLERCQCEDEEDVEKVPPSMNSELTMHVLRKIMNGDEKKVKDLHGYISNWIRKIEKDCELNQEDDLIRYRFPGLIEPASPGPAPGSLESISQLSDMFSLMDINSKRGWT